MDGKVVPHGHDGIGAITFDLPGGSHQVALNLEDTAVRKIGDYLSLASWALFALVALGWAVQKAGRMLKERPERKLPR